MLNEMTKKIIENNPKTAVFSAPQKPRICQIRPKYDDNNCISAPSRLNHIVVRIEIFLIPVDSVK